MEVQDPALREGKLRGVGLLGRQVDTFNRRVRELIASDPDTDRRYRILTSIPGVGPVSAATLCCWMPELGSIWLKAAGKRHKVALDAIMRKLIVLANVLLRDARPWADTAPEACA